MANILDRIDWRFTSEEGRAWLDRFEGETFEIAPVKHAEQKTVHFHSTGVYLKRNYYKGLRSIYKAFTGGNAEKEGKIALAMKKQGVPVPDIMAFGRLKFKGKLVEDILITREIRNGKALSDFIQNGFQQLDFRQKKNIVRKFAEFISKLHDSGIYHRDFHLNNVLIVYQENKVDFSILDLDKVALYSGPLPLAKRKKQLGVLFAVCLGLCSRNDCFRFMNAYRPENSKDEKTKLIRGISRAVAIHLHNLLAQRARQSVGTNTRFVREDLRDFEIYRSRELGEDIPSAVDLENKKSGEFLFHGKRFFLKKYSDSVCSNRIANIFIRRSGRNRWKHIWRFPHKKIPIPSPLMMVCRKSGRFHATSFLVSEYLSDSLPLNEYWAQTNTVDKKRLCVKLGILIGCLHQFGTMHRNLNWFNILVCPHDKSEKLYLWSIEKSKKYRLLRKSTAENDLRELTNELSENGADGHMMYLFMNSWRKWAGYL